MQCRKTLIQLNPISKSVLHYFLAIVYQNNPDFLSENGKKLAMKTLERLEMEEEYLKKQAEELDKALS